MGKRKYQKRSRESVAGFEGNAANPERTHWMRELGKSNTTQRHVPTPRKGTRREREHHAIRDQKARSDGR